MLNAKMRDQVALAPRGRFAPTPSGRLHWGNLRSSLLAWLQIRLQRGTMVMRVEDIDQGRCRAALQDQMLADLDWLGLDWDEGPDIGGPFGPYLQSQRGSLYARAIDQLATYPCTCSRAELTRDRAQGRLPACWRCRTQGAKPGQPHALRWALPETLPTFADLRLGLLHPNERAELDDPVVLGRDGRSRYTLAVVVDDAAMRIDTVCRGADLLLDTHRQVALAMALGYPLPSYFHLPLVLGPDGQKLSKSKGSPCLHALREQGATAGQVVASLAQSCGLLSRRCLSISARELLRELNLEQLLAIHSKSTV